jgi:hypothetical protein
MFVAIMDGDDLWIDENKLKMQIDFLVNNPDYVLTFHNTSIRNTELDEITTYKKKYPDRFLPFLKGGMVTHEQIVKWKGILGATSSIVFRNPFKLFPEWVKELYGLEPMLFTILHPYGKYKYFDRIMSVYRIHSSSTDRSFSQFKKAERNIGEYLTYQKHFRPLYFKFYQKKIISNRAFLIYKCFKDASFFKAFKNLFLLVKESFFYFIN